VQRLLERLPSAEQDGTFWAMGIDGAGQRIETVSSNPGHALWAGLLRGKEARPTVDRLLAEDMLCGWGIRTLSGRARTFNPMSYHNGSIWPHDTGICAFGMSRYGERRGAVHITTTMFEAAAQFDMRLPELFCGFPRVPGDAPIAYPVACLPQAWAAGSVFMMLQACLGLRVDGEAGLVEVTNPHLPIGIDHFSILKLGLGDEVFDLHFERHGQSPLRRTVATECLPP